MNFKFFLLKRKKINKFGLNYHRCIVRLLVCVFWSVLSENTNGKKFLPVGLFSPLRGSIVPIYTKIMYDLIIAVINKYFEFQND